MKSCIKYAFQIAVAIWFSAASANSFVDFFRAVGLDDTRTVGRLLERGFDPNAVAENGQTALYLALRDGSFEVAALLLAHPQIRIDAANAVGETPLMIAALKGRTDWLTRLLQRGAALEREGWTPLHYAASGPEPAAVQMLLERGARIEALSPNKTTPLMMAARYGNTDSAELLLARGANAKARNDAGLTAADFARSAGRDRLARKLEEAAARP